MLSARRLERRKKIIHAAFEVFARHGFAFATIDLIAEQANAAKGTVYLYFESKENLFEAMVVEKLTPVLDALNAIPFAPGVSASDRLARQFSLI